MTSLAPSKRTSILLGGSLSGIKPNLHQEYGAKVGKTLAGVEGVEVSVPNDRLHDYIQALPEDISILSNSSLFPREGARESARNRRGSDDAERFEIDYVSRPKGMADLHSQGLDGSGVTIAVIDSGISLHPDFQDRVKVFKDFSDTDHAEARDEYGHGTSVAGVAAGDGPEIDGIAPGADLVALKITSAEEAIEALDWVVQNKERYGIDVVNMSLGELPWRPSPSAQDPWAQATKRAIDNGLVTVAAAGNECKHNRCSGTINTPGYLPEVITVGAYDDEGTIDPGDDVMWRKSSNGPTVPDGLAKPDLVAQGHRVWAAGAEGSDLMRARPNAEGYMRDSGSSMAVPMVSGAAAVMLQANPNLTHQEIKAILKSTAVPMDGVDEHAQGAGRLDLERAVRLAQASRMLFA